MRILMQIAAGRLAAAVLFLAGPLSAAEAKPNFLVILADDLGYSDLGCYGGEIDTPNLDRIAAGGLRFTEFYNTGRCWPTRGALLTGYYPQQIRRDAMPGLGKGLGGQGRRQDWAVLLPARLKELGYRSYHAGKWHVDGEPCEGGFDRSYHWKDQGRFFHPQVHFEDDQPLPPVPRDEPGFYGTIHTVDRLLGYLDQHQREHSGKPFCAYLAFAAPHFPLQALPEDIAKYKERYRAGWDALRKERLERMKAAGLVTDAGLSPLEVDVGPPYDFPDAMEKLGPGEVNRPLPWDSLTPEQREFQATKMAIHAAMVDCMDREIGRVLEWLEKTGAADNTALMFLSDNGASAEIMVRDDGHDPAAEPGSAATYLCLGPGFSSLCNTPFRRHKTWTHEGGISTPFILHWPAGIQEEHRGQIRQGMAHVIDLAPTIVELAGVTARPVPGGPALAGRSLVPMLADPSARPHDALWFYHEGNRALRVGDYKIVAANDEEQWALHDLSKDRAEQMDLAADDPERVRRMVRDWHALANAFRGTALEGKSLEEFENAAGAAKGRGKGKAGAKAGGGKR
jgi:arylsulfatase A-like enzyme